MMMKANLVIGKMEMRQYMHLRRSFSATNLKPEFYVPKNERNAARFVFPLEYPFGEERLMRNDRLCPTRELNFTPNHWKKHKSPYRKIRHVINTFRSSPVQRLMYPDLFMTASVAVGLAAYNEFFAAAMGYPELGMPSAAFAGATTAIGLLAGFRLNTSYGRYEECRIFWGNTINTIRDLAGNTMMWMKDVDQRTRMLKLCKAYPVTLNFHLNAKGGHHNIRRDDPSKPNFNDRIQAEFEAELRDIYNDGKDEADFNRLCDVKYKGGSAPLEALTCMRETIAASAGTQDAIYMRAMDWQCERLCGSYGASERVLRTSLPTSFTRLTSRLMFVWSNTLPLALYPALGPIATLPVSVITAFAILGIEDVGVQLEEPFDILPLRQYSDGMFDSISMIEKNFTPYVIGSPEAKKIAFTPTLTTTPNTGFYPEPFVPTLTTTPNMTLTKSM